ncbi:hypothetical protein SDC9_190493 [bioreactor metagenome]|uniref:Uncharacterized protein n=1 Tax=bioreactor metagenome TaxID=1076179 RepID=A0A645HV53_9ZZZZ
MGGYFKGFWKIFKRNCLCELKHIVFSAYPYVLLDVKSCNHSLCRPYGNNQLVKFQSQLP